MFLSPHMWMDLLRISSIPVFLDHRKVVGNFLLHTSTIFNYLFVSEVKGDLYSMSSRFRSSAVKLLFNLFTQLQSGGEWYIRPRSWNPCECKDMDQRLIKSHEIWALEDIWTLGRLWALPIIILCTIAYYYARNWKWLMSLASVVLDWNYAHQLSRCSPGPHRVQAPPLKLVVRKSWTCGTHLPKMYSFSLPGVWKYKIL